MSIYIKLLVEYIKLLNKWRVPENKGAWDSLMLLAP